MQDIVCLNCGHAVHPYRNIEDGKCFRCRLPKVWTEHPSLGNFFGKGWDGHFGTHKIQALKLVAETENIDWSESLIQDEVFDLLFHTLWVVVNRDTYNHLSGLLNDVLSKIPEDANASEYSERFYRLYKNRQVLYARKATSLEIMVDKSHELDKKES